MNSVRIEKTIQRKENILYEINAINRVSTELYLEPAGIVSEHTGLLQQNYRPAEREEDIQSRHRNTKQLIKLILFH